MVSICDIFIDIHMEPSEPPSWGLYLIITVVLLLFSMFFSAAETAVLSSSRLRIRYLKEKGNKAAGRIDRQLAKKNRFLNLILIGNNVVNIAMSSLITSVAMKEFGDAGVGIATAFATLIILIFGEILPKSVALQRPESIALSFSLPLAILSAVMSPVVLLFSLITKGLSAILVPKAARENQNDSRIVTEEDIRMLFEAGEEEGVIESNDRRMMNNILSYTDLTARDVMTPRTAIEAVRIDATKEEIIERSRTTRCSRFPVYGEDIDDILGILFVKDFILSAEADEEPFSVKKFLRPALFVLENRKITELQATLRREKRGIAVVIDEYGGTAGIVTAADLAAEIFGTIADEYDETRAATYHSGSGPDAGSLMPGTERLTTVNERFGLRLASDFYDTIGGWILEKSGEVPAVGFPAHEAEYVFTVRQLDGNRIASVAVEKTEARP
jgi:CBS domain containing-hemolysin-like protein